VMQEEIFGPIFPIVTVQNLDEAIAFVNLRDKPLACYAFVDAEKQADLIIQSILAGAIVINEGLIQFANDHLPFGGIGKSGMGSYHGKHSFKAFTHAMPVIKSSYAFDNALRYPPFKKTGRWILKLVKWIG
jgi:aldehyde dehydrogenase (NAD+)